MTCLGGHPPASEYRFEVEYLADQLRQYLDRTIGDLADDMRAGVGAEPALAERLKGYEHAVADIQAMLRDPGHQFHRGVGNYVAAARQRSG